VIKFYIRVVKMGHPVWSDPPLVNHLVSQPNLVYLLTS